MTNKLALVTGGSRGIGKCVADMMRAQGWNVIAPIRRVLDFSIQQSVVNWEGNMIETGVPPIDSIIFCHGEWFSKETKDFYPDDWIKQFISRVVWPAEHMDFLIHGNHPVESVVMVSSTRGFIGGVNTAPYSVACAAQIALMQGYAREYQGVRFNCVCPSLTATDMGRQVIATGGAKSDAVPQPPEAVAQVIVDLVTDGASNGRVVRVVDGKASDARWVWE